MVYLMRAMMEIFYARLCFPALFSCCVALVPLHGAITQGSLRAAGAYSGARRGFSLLVARHDKVIFEDYENGGSPLATHKICSGTKGFWVVATLVAVHEGLLTLDERVSDTITEWRSNALKRAITVREVMNFTDGIDPAFQLHGESIQDRNGYAIRVPVVAKPGTAFIYGPEFTARYCANCCEGNWLRGGKRRSVFSNARCLILLALAPLSTRRICSAIP